MHIKARLQLLRSGQSTGLSNQHSVPVPQDVHPQQYQAAGVGAPPGVQWGMGAPASGPPGQGPTPPVPVNEWSRQLAAIDRPQQPPPSLYDQRDAIRPPPLSPRQQQQQRRQYDEQLHRHTSVRRPSPPPSNVNHIAPVSYPGSQGLPQPTPLQPQPVPTRIPNPNHPAATPGIGSSNGYHNGPGPLPPTGRGNSPPPEIRPIADDRVTSPSPGYPHQQYQPHPTLSNLSNHSNPGGIAGGAPPPIAALAAAEAAAAAGTRDREERPAGGYKRMVDPDDEYKLSHKKPANGEIRNRLDDHLYRRASPPERPASRHRRSSSEIRREDQHRVNESYHPSEAAHHPTSLPSLHQPQEPLPPSGEGPRDNVREPYEPAARKMDVDEDYDEDVEDEKRMIGSGGRNSPQRGIMNGQPKSEPQG